MIVRHFLDWVRTAPAGKRAEATAALARAYLYSDLSPDDAAAAEGAMLILLDDPSPLVRRALADVLAASPSAPPAVVLALAADQPQIAAPVLALSPLFVDADLVDAVATGNEDGQIAIASRRAGRRPRPLCPIRRGRGLVCYWPKIAMPGCRVQSIAFSNVLTPFTALLAPRATTATSKWCYVSGSGVFVAAVLFDARPRSASPRGHERQR
jgi:hypothetical protein